jgi:NADPH:quinone reductase-like Zn-dependent oxidoreductase
MRAVVLTEPGSVPTLAQLKVPEPGEGEVRVHVHAASVNGFDLAVAAGYLTGMMEHRYPVVLGKDFAGIVDAVGVGVTDYTAGERVFGVVTKPYLGDGSFGEYVVVPVAVGLAKLPASVGFPEGAALGLAGTAALDAVDAAQLQPGQVVLVVGATGGVGTQVVQLAAKAGARVIATAQTDKERALVTGLGASDVVDHTQDLAAQVGSLASGGVDVVVHLAGDTGSLLPLVRDGGRFVSTLLGTPDQLPADNLTVVPVAANPAPTTLDRLARHQAEGTTRLVLQKIYPMDATPAAFADFAAGSLGKLVISTQ